MNSKHRLPGAMVALALVSGCGEEAVEINKSAQETLQLAFLDAKPGDVITIPEGVTYLDRSLSLNANGVTIRGAGADTSVLSFKGQKQGAEGILASGDDLVFENFAIEDTIGDALKVNEGSDLVIRGMRVEWTRGPDTDNGAYGLYPVQMQNVLVENNIVRAASDAGIYVGQSRNIIVRHNIAEDNVAGIEIENSVDADVHNNIAKHNTGGILVFNMPNLPQRGERTRVFSNVVTDNNTDNFAAEGTPVASVPKGSGIVINSNDHVEIFKNVLKGNDTAHIIISSVYSSNFADGKQDDAFDAYPEGIHIHQNSYEDGGSAPGMLELKALKTVMFGPFGSLPAVLWDGFEDASKRVDGQLPDALKICIGEEPVEVLKADAPNGFDSPKLVTENHRCSLAPLTAVRLSDKLARKVASDKQGR